MSHYYYCAPAGVRRVNRDFPAATRYCISTARLGIWYPIGSSLAMNHAGPTAPARLQLRLSGGCAHKKITSTSTRVLVIDALAQYYYDAGPTST